MTEGTHIPDEKDNDLRPIPDGGLATSLPDWLKERPAWSQETKSDGMLPPDTSPIDPRTLVRDEDLPEWLRAIALREAGPVTLPDLESDPDPDEPEVITPADFEQLTTQANVPPKPEWQSHAIPESVIPADSTGDLQHWLTSGEVSTEKRKLVTDPVLAAFIIAAAIIIAVGIYLWFS